MSRQLSKGTLGLKFMNRVQPASPASASSSAPPSKSSTPAPPPAQPSRPTPTTSDRTAEAAPPTTKAGKAGVAVRGAQPSTRASEPVDDEAWGSTTVPGRDSRPTVVHESSLLSFPLLSTLSTTSSFTSSSSYSSMPLTSSAISGRRSFGGANIEIEKLNDPTAHPTPDPAASKSKDKDPKSALNKKRRKAERDAATVSSSIRRRASGSSSALVSGNKAGKRAAELERERDAAGSKRRKSDEGGDGEAMDPIRWEVDDDEVSFSGSPAAGAASKGDGSKSAKQQRAEFAKPAGYEGAKKGKGKGKGKGVMGDYGWGKQGETREWDEGKEDDSESESEAEEGEFEEGSSSDGSEDIEEMLMPVKTKGRNGKGGRREVEREVQRSEQRFTGEGSRGAGGKKGTKRR
ncbi:hypothetical protein JCM1840_002663 [Sporobolomyces johnsonii]